jgi:long-chain acyl-CoA synthetase
VRGRPRSESNRSVTARVDLDQSFNLEAIMSNLATILVHSAKHFPERVALRCNSQSLTFAELDDAAARFATVLEREGIGPGDRVGIMLPNIPAFAVLFYATLRRGAIAVPINPLLKTREVEFYLSNTGAKTLFASPSYAGVAREAAAFTGATMQVLDDDILAASIAEVIPQQQPVECVDLDTAVILHTSGTTGKPKGAELTHDGLIRNAEVTARTLLELGPDDVVMGCLPLFHVFGLTCGLNAAILAGAALTLLLRFDPRTAIEAIERDGITVLEGVPTMYAAMLGVAADFSASATASLRVGVSSGAPLPAQVLADFDKEFGVTILEGYGLSETSPVACSNHLRGGRKPGSIGTPIEGVEMRIVDDTGHALRTGDVGEIQIRGHNVMKGYWNRPIDTAEVITTDGWFSSGDIGRMDEDGHFYIVDRKKSLIIRGGFNVYPREIEEVLHEHPSVVEAVVIGIPDDILGEEIGAAVALRNGAHAEPEDLRDFVKERVAPYKYPRHVWIFDSLPKGPTGKLLRREISILATQAN